jgi:hypothetical protein
MVAADGATVWVWWLFYKTPKYLSHNNENNSHLDYDLIFIGIE